MWMKKRHFDVESDEFYGAYWKCKKDNYLIKIKLALNT